MKMTKNYKYFLYGTDAIPEWFNKQYDGQYVITDEGFTFTADPLDTDDPYVQEIKKKEQNTDKIVDPIFEYFQVGVDSIPDWFQDYLASYTQMDCYKRREPKDSSDFHHTKTMQEIDFTEFPISWNENQDIQLAYFKDYIVRNKETKYVTVFSHIKYDLLFGKKAETEGSRQKEG